MSTSPVEITTAVDPSPALAALDRVAAAWPEDWVVRSPEDLPALVAMRRADPAQFADGAS